MKCSLDPCSCHEMFVSPDLQILLILSWWLQPSVRHAGGWYPCPVTCSRQSGPDKISTLNQWPELTCLDFCLCDKIADCFMWALTLQRRWWCRGRRRVQVLKVIFKSLHWIELKMLWQYLESIELITTDVVLQSQRIISPVQFCNTK